MTTASPFGPAGPRRRAARPTIAGVLIVLLVHLVWPGPVPTLPGPPGALDAPSHPALSGPASPAGPDGPHLLARQGADLFGLPRHLRAEVARTVLGNPSGPDPDNAVLPVPPSAGTAPRVPTGPPGGRTVPVGAGLITCRYPTGPPAA